MNKKQLALVAFLAVGISLNGIFVASAAPSNANVIDGDTITLSNGDRVRLLQIDTPELNTAECFGNDARSALVSLLSAPGQLTLRADPNLDKVDRYGRLLRYVFIGKTNINLRMVEIGAAAPYFYRGEKGQYSNQILKAAQNAKSKSLGLWKSCPGTQLAPNNAITTLASVSTQTSSVGKANTNCDPNYAGCIPVFPQDVDCSDIKRLGLAPVKVIGKDIHRLDRDGDGKGCDK